ncbi:hypothetical protein QFC21_004965 [Naganishia friedmannii]|uniref:Uncharacterized protein n=1 Tax=Naganishia friedmannii TaxID=89922 RepID=A0ACC2VDZ5_9TREE|nr:hypothetical protein QFC21_004965 [Naganishia friedmannii]
MSEPSFEFEKYLIVPEITIVSSTPDAPLPPPAPPTGSDGGAGNPGDDHGLIPEIIKVPRVGGVDDGWLLLDYVEEESSEQQVKKDLSDEPVVSPFLRRNNTNAITADANADQGRTAE